MPDMRFPRRRHEDVNPEPDKAFRCSFCNHDWPWATPFAKTCPLCDQPTSPLKLTPMTDEEAAELLAAVGLTYELKPIRRRIPIGRTPTAQEIKDLYDDIAAWHLSAPPWVRK